MKKLCALVFLTMLMFTLAGCSGGIEAPAAQPVPDNNLVTAPTPNYELEETLNPAPQSDAQEDLGIIAVATEMQGGLVSRIVLINIDPVTGETRGIREFVTTGLRFPGFNTGDFGRYAMNGPILSPQLNETMDRFAVTMPSVGIDNASHVGWVESRGNFFDVSALIIEPQDDFSETIQHRNPQFGANGYFYFASLHRARSDWQSNLYNILRVPLDDLSPETVEIMASEIEGGDFHIHLDGSVSTDKGRGTPIESIADGNLVVPRDGYRFTPRQWVGENTMLAVYHGNVLRNTYDTAVPTLVYLNAVPRDDNFGNVMDAVLETMQFILPANMTRISWDAVMSPDGTEIAFFSRSTTSTAPELFIASANGENSRRIDVDRSLTNFRILSWGIN